MILNLVNTGTSSIRDKNVKSTINVNQKNHKNIIGSHLGAGTKDALK